MTPDDTPTVTPTDIVRHLWARRYLLLLAPPLFFIGTYLYTVFMMGQTFESSTTLMLRTPTSMLREGPRIERIDAPSVPDLLSSDAMLREVVNAARAKFPSYPQGNFEKIKGAYSVRTIITRDTTVQATYSPAVILTTKGSSPEIALFLAEEWTRVAVERFGKARAREASQIQTTLQSTYDKYASESADIVKKQSALELRRDELDALYASRQALLNGQVSSTASMNEAGEAVPGGLVGEKARLELGLAAPADGEREGLRARLTKVEELIRQTLGEIEIINKERASLRDEIEAVRRDLLVARERTGQIRTILTTTTADATLIPDPENPDVQGDLSILARPVLAETRVSPQRGLVATGGCVFLSAVLLALILVELYIRRLVLEA